MLFLYRTQAKRCQYVVFWLGRLFKMLDHVIALSVVIYPLKMTRVAHREDFIIAEIDLLHARGI